MSDRNLPQYLAVIAAALGATTIIIAISAAGSAPASAPTSAAYVVQSCGEVQRVAMPDGATCYVISCGSSTVAIDCVPRGDRR